MKRIAEEPTLPNHGPASDYFNDLLRDLKKQLLGYEYEPITMERLTLARLAAGRAGRRAAAADTAGGGAVAGEGGAGGEDGEEEDGMTDSLCEQYQRWAREAVDEWDGQKTMDLLRAIVAKTGEAGLMDEMYGGLLNEIVSRTNWCNVNGGMGWVVNAPFSVYGVARAVKDDAMRIQEGRELRCPKCGYTKADAELYGDHCLCDGVIPAPSPPPPALDAGVQGAEGGTRMRPKKLGTVQTINAQTGEVIAEKRNAMTLLPPAQDVCQVCATDHPWDQPHNQQSMYYQYAFYSEHGRWPTWTDAMAHCTPELQAAWKEHLIEVMKEHGQDVPDDLMQGPAKGR